MQFQPIPGTKVIESAADTPLKCCTICKISHPLSAYRKRSDCDALRTECRACLAQRCRDWNRAHPGYKSRWRRDHPVQHAQQQLRTARKRRYGLTDDDIELLVRRQHNQCAICWKGFTTTPHVDHDHVTGRVRGLLCRPCNRALGMFKDDADLVRNALLYLAGALS